MRPITAIFAGAAALAAALAAAPAAVAQEEAEALAKKLSNPLADMISVPVQVNLDHGYGPQDGRKLVTNFQPVIPISLSEDWNLISRTIVPVVWNNDVVAGSEKFGFGDVVQSMWLSPKAATAGGLTWGVGGAFLLPTATDSQLGGEKWGAGPTAVGLIQNGPWTYGALANHIWSFAGDDSRGEVNASFIQPFISYTTPDAWTFSLNSESTYDWRRDQWSIPVNAMVSKLLDVNGQKLSVQAGLRYWLDAPEGGPEGLGARVAFTFLFPK